MAAPLLYDANAARWSYPDARLVLPVDTPRDQWLAERRKGIGGSDTPVLLGESPYNQSLYGLWLDKTGQTEDDELTDAMRRGNWLEPHLADWFTERTGIQVRRCGLLASRERDHLRTNPDRLSADGGLVEIKTTDGRSETAKEWRAGVARHAYIQGQQQLAVTGRSHVWFVAWMDPSPLIRGPFGRDEALIAEIFERADKFWAVNVIGNTPPEVDLATITDEEIALRWPVEIPGSRVEARYPSHVRALLEERAELKSRLSRDDKRAKEIDAALRVMAGDAEALTVDGKPIVTFKSQLNNPSVDKALAADHPDIYARYITRTSSRRIHVVKPRKGTAA